MNKLAEMVVSIQAHVRVDSKKENKIAPLAKPLVLSPGSLMDGLLEEPGCGYGGHVWSHCLLVQPVSCTV